MTFNFFYPEIFLSTTILLHLIFNSLIVTYIPYNFPILNKELIGQIQFFFVLTFLLVFNFDIEGYSYGFLFLLN
jgi:hypothetical protein